MENRHLDALRRIYQADQSLSREGREHQAFHLRHAGGMESHVDHPRWERSWAVPSEQTIDDLGELDLFRVEPSDNKARKFSLTMKGRQEAAALVDPSTRPTAGTTLNQAGVSSDQDSDPRKVMVVYGRDTAAKTAMFDFLRRLDLWPQEWSQLISATGEATPYIGQTLDAAFRTVRGVVVLFTPDDVVRLHPGLQRDNDPREESEWTLQPRPNALFEAGLAFGRQPTRTVLVELGRLRGLTDLLGRHAVRLDGGVPALRQLVQRLKDAGCQVNDSGDDWLDPGLFRLPSRVPTAGPIDRSAQNPPVSNASSGRATSDVRTLSEILERALEFPPTEDVAPALLTILGEQNAPFHFDGITERLPGRRLDPGPANKLRYELEQHGFLARNQGPERAYVLGERFR